MPSEVFLSLGSNLGRREENIKKALSLLEEKGEILKKSSLYETEPMEIKEQPPFLNMTIKYRTELSPRDLLLFLKDIERRLGRKGGIRYGPRIIDIDILLYEDAEISEEDLIIPHPKLGERAFYLVPLLEIEPEIRHPSLGKIKDLLRGAKGEVRKWEDLR